MSATCFGLAGGFIAAPKAAKRAPMKSVLGVKMEKVSEIASKLLDDWDIKHFGRCPIANGSFQYKTRIDLIAMITQALREAEARGMERAAKVWADGVAETQVRAERWLTDAAKAHSE